MKKLLFISAGLCFLAAVIGWWVKLWTPRDARVGSALPAHSFYSFDLKESEARIPCLQAEIEGISFFAKLDTGYDGVMSMPKELLEQLKRKQDAGTVVYGSIKGKTYTASVYNVPKLYIGDLALVNVPVEESNLDFEQDTCLSADCDVKSLDITTRIGWRAFLGSVFLIDFPNSTAICSDSLQTLRERGYLLDSLISVNFLSDQQFLEFEANIGGHILKCLLDTGSTLNLLHTPSSESSEFANLDLSRPLSPISFAIEGYTLEPCIFHETQLPFGAEAILGMDFLKTQVVCIDFINHKLFLSPRPSAI